MTANHKAILAGAVFWYFFIRRPAAEVRAWQDQTDVALVFDGDMTAGNRGLSWPPV